MDLDVIEFIRRFMLHIVPYRFVRIRYYGLLAHRNKKKSIIDCFNYFDIKIETECSEKREWYDIYFDVTGFDIKICPKCKSGEMVVKELSPELIRPPPLSNKTA